MEEQNQPEIEESSQSEQGSGGSSKPIVIVLAVALVAAIIGIIALLAIYVLGDGSGDDGEAPAPTPTAAEIVAPPMATVEATVIPPTPEPGEPTATVIARKGVNVRTGPALNFPVIGIAPFGAVLEVVGVSQDGTWWVIEIPGAPNNYGWVSEEFVQVENTNNVLVIPSPPTPTPAATATATATPAPQITFTTNRDTINAGEKATLSWSVENVAAVYMYPVGDSFENYPTTGQDSRDVQPYITTSYELLVFNPDGSTAASRIEIGVLNGLPSGRWILSSYSTPSGGFQRPIQGSEITARFGADGSLSGSAGCNSYNSSFMAFDQTLRVYNVAPSQAWCSDPAGIMEQEGTFLDLLQRASRMAISAGQLTVYDSSGSRILEFVSG